MIEPDYEKIARFNQNQKAFHQVLTQIRNDAVLLNHSLLESTLTVEAHDIERINEFSTFFNELKGKIK